MNYIITYSLIIGIFLASVKAQSNADLREIDSIGNERECVMQGGTCVIAKDCPEGSLSTLQGLCPEQRSRGVECCYGMKETRCRKRGGGCVEPGNCPSALVYSEATDCETGTECCILV